MSVNQTSFKGVWSDGTTIWIGDNTKDKLWAYDLATGKRDPGSDFKTPKATGNQWISNFWSDGAIMWVPDWEDDKIYAYNMPGNADLGGLSLSPGTLEPAFHRVTTSYAASAPSDVSSITVTATASDAANATVEFLDGDDLTLADADPNTAGHQVDLALGENTIKIRVTAGDGSTTRTYTLVLTLVPNTDLSDLRVNGVSVPGFGSEVEYTFSGVQHGVAASVTQATIEAVTDDPDASVVYVDTDADDVTDGHQLNLSEGRNAISIEVTAADEVTTRTYLLSVNRGTDAPFGWRAQDDFDTLLAAGVTDPEGLWSDGATMWVADDRDPHRRALRVRAGHHVARSRQGLRHPVGGFEQERPGHLVGQTRPCGWRTGMTKRSTPTRWIRRSGQRQGHQFGLGQSTGTDRPGTFGLTARPSGWWTKVRPKALRLSAGHRGAGLGQGLHRGRRPSPTPGVSGPTARPSGSETIAKDKLYAYDLATGKRDPGSDFNTLQSEPATHGSATSGPTARSCGSQTG